MIIKPVVNAMQKYNNKISDVTLTAKTLITIIRKSLILQGVS